MCIHWIGQRANSCADAHKRLTLASFPEKDETTQGRPRIFGYGYAGPDWLLVRVLVLELIGDVM